MKPPVWLVVVAGILMLSGCATTTKEEPASQNERAALINVQLGAAYMEQGKYDIAMEKLQRALKEDPSLASAHHAIGYLYEHLGELDDASKHYRRAVSLDPDDSNAHNTYGAFLCRQRKWKEAEEQFALALKNPLYKSPEVAYTNAGICELGVPDLKAAEGNLRRALEIDSNYPSALFAMAQLSLSAGRYLPARAYLERYFGVAPKSAGSLWLGIQVERALGNRDIEASYELLLKRNFPDSQETALLLESEQHGQGTGN